MSGDQAITNADLSRQVGALSTQFEVLSQINRQQSEKLVVLESKFSEVPQKMDQLIAMQIEVARSNQAQIEHSRQIGVLFEMSDKMDTKVEGTRRKLAQYAGGIAVIVILLGLGSWYVQQTLTLAFTEFKEIHATLANQTDAINLLQFRADQPQAYANTHIPEKK